MSARMRYANSIQPIRVLRDLPNQEGYRFIGVDLDGAEHECIVVKDGVGCHTVHRVADGEPFFFKLYGWREKRHTDIGVLVAPHKDG